VLDLTRNVFETLRSDQEFVLCRGRNIDDASRILLLSPATVNPSTTILRRLEHEYSLRQTLDAAWSVRPIALANHWDRPVLVMEDPGGVTLDHLLGYPLDLPFTLGLAINLSGAIDESHRRGVVHKDIKPANVLVNSFSGQCWLTGFGISSRLPRERQPAEPPEFVAGTLAYMAPEQTGRMNRSIDSRSDLYSLGITLYQMLTGTLPFTASEPMEWVHCHIARRAVPASERSKDVPTAVSAIVMKLLAKTAEERYQTASGVKHDLERCLGELEGSLPRDPLRRARTRALPDANDERETIPEFALGERDIPDRLLIPEKLYGRAREIDTLLAMFERVSGSGRLEVVLVSGYSGIGKSSVVNELQKVLVPPRGFFASGKFDQYKREIPYATLAQAFQGLIRPLLGKSDVELSQWRDALREALDPNGQLIVDLVPELAPILGEQTPVPELPAQDAQRRFQLVLRRFISVFARPEHPLALFLDDLQWLDAATLDLIGDLLTQPDVKHLLFIGAYRDNEVNAAHPLMRKLEQIRQAGAIAHEMVLAPLSCEDLGRLTADSLHCEPVQAAPLAHLVHKRTGGNPFFATQLIAALAEEGLLRFDHASRGWAWDVSRIGSKGYTDNVVDLMVGKLTRLPIETQKALKELACLGNSAEISTLTTVHGTSEEEVHSDLWEALRLEFIVRLEASYEFVHDRVQEAAYSLIPEASRAEAHLQIGRLLMASTRPERREEAIFQIVNQLNRGAVLIDSRDEREQLAELNLTAGKRAKASTAYTSALKYFVTGAALLVDNPAPESADNRSGSGRTGNAQSLLTSEAGERRHELSFALELYRGECEFLTGELAAAEEHLKMLSFRAASTVELASVACLLMDLYTTLDRSDRAVAVCLDYLRHVGVEWSPHPTAEEARREYDRIWIKLGSRAVEELIDLPLMSDPASLATLDVLTKALPPALHTDANLVSLAVCRAVNLSLAHGNGDGSCFPYVYLGMIAGPRFNNYKAGFQFGRLGYELVEKRGLKRFQGRTYMCFGSHVIPWNKHIRAGRDLIRRGFDSANKIGDLTYAANSCNNLNANLLAAGDPLVEVQREAENGLEFAQTARYGLVVDNIATQLGLIRTLRGLTPKFGSFEDEQFDELRFERHLVNDPALALAECWYWIRKLQARFFAGDYASAVEASQRAQRLLWTSPSFFEAAEYHFYSALARAAVCDAIGREKQFHDLLTLAEHHEQLALWAENCPENFENRAALVGAEIARIEGRELDAESLYEQAIRSARENDFVQNEAIAYELAARFYAARGLQEFARLYLRRARYAYLRWGAAGKVRQLDDLHPYLKREEPMANPVGTIEASVEHLDLATVLKVSQAVSGEIVIERLIDMLMRTAIEHAGAGHGLLILPHGSEQWIEAEATTTGSTISVHLQKALVTETTAPQSIIRYVVRTMVSVILNDASAQNPFSEDPYVRHCEARSMLCMPLINQGKLIGILYLENNLASQVFTPTRVAVLKLLASQAAICLENTRLYHDLEEREARIRCLVEANVVGIVMFTLEGAITGANEAFLHMVQYSREDIASGHVRWTDLTPNEWRDRDERAVADLKASGIFQPFEKEYFRRDGSRVPALLGGALFEVGGDEGVAFVLDLSEQKRAEEALRRNEAYLSEAQRLSQTGSFGWDVTNGKIYWSQETFRIFEYDPGTEPTLELVLDRTHPGDRSMVGELIDRVSDERKDFDFEHRILMPDGSVKYLRVVGHPSTKDESGRFQYVGAVTDITERKLAEKALKEKEVSLHETQTELAHVSRVTTMGELAASIAHEVNQPLVGVLSNASASLRFLAGHSPNLVEAREAMRAIIRDGNRAADVVARMRALFKKARLAKEPININQAIEEVVLLTQGEARRNKVMLRAELSTNLPSVMADRVQIQQVVMNLILNGIQAMSGVEDAERVLVVRTQRGEGDEIRVAVQDCGIGIDPGSIERIFEAFHTTKPGGMGMGLSISRSIIESHGGRLWATPNDGPGVTLQFTL
jgi:PAS domain S-box-containing protein